MKFFYLDFEAGSKVDLRKCGMYKYALSETTKPFCMAYAFVQDMQDFVVELWTKFSGLSLPIPKKIINDPEVYFVAHNAPFEKLILEHRFNIFIPWDRWIDTAAICRHHSLPGDLGRASKLFGVAKDTEKGKSIKYLFSPNPATGELYTQEEDPAGYKYAFEYCVDDIYSMVNLHRKLGNLSKTETKIWILTQKMNERGIPIDTVALEKAKILIEKELIEYEQKIRELTKCDFYPEGLKYTQNKKLLAFLGVDSIRKSAVLDLLRDDSLPDLNRKILEHMQVVKATSIRKIDAISRSIVDGRVHFCFIYSGADRTGRWSAKLIQPQNFPRGDSKTHEYFALENWEELPKPWVNTIRDMLRGFITTPKGILKVDYSQVEARQLCLFAGQTDVLEQFADPKQDPYISMGAAIYGVDEKTISKDSEERFLGKQAILSCGYQVWVDGFRTMLKEFYDVTLPEELLYKAVTTYRAKNDKIVQFWAECEIAFKLAMVEGKEQVISDGRLKFNSPFPGKVEIRLPSGRKLHYWDCRLSATGKIRVYGKIPQSSRWGMVSLYGGKIAENVTQATTRDLLARAGLRLDRADFNLFMSIHDEFESEDSEERLPEYIKIMEQQPKWAKGMPIAVDAEFCTRYKK